MKRGRPEVNPQNCGINVEQAAEMLNVGTRSVESAKQVLEHGSKALIEAVASRVRAREVAGNDVIKYYAVVLVASRVRAREVAGLS